MEAEPQQPVILFCWWSRMVSPVVCP